MSERNFHRHRMTRCDDFKRSCLSVDIYSQPFNLLLPDGKTHYRTFSGVLMTLLTFVIVLIYATRKLEILIKLQDFKVQVHDLTYEFTAHDDINASHGFMVAASIPKAFG